jgi:predicted nucleotidyltransferase component of viral defense system
MELNAIEKIKRQIVLALFSDDTLMDILVLKGGNALNVIYKISDRASIDLDFSIHGDIDSLEEFAARVQKTLQKTLLDCDYVVFDFKFQKRPQVVADESPAFWGGYDVVFKIIEKAKYEQFCTSIEVLRRNATAITSDHQKNFVIQISKHEFCEGKKEVDLDGLTVYVYSPEMIVFEKFRSICQQMREYQYRRKTSTARARDFFDIYTVMHSFSVDLASDYNLMLMKGVFEAKAVPLALLKLLNDYREFHRPDFTAVRNTVTSHVQLLTYDDYFDFSLATADSLCQALGVV